MFNKGTTLVEILKKPEDKKILVKYNLPCLICPFANLEMEDLKIGKICEMYKIDIDSLLKDLNEGSKDK
jgi:hypothetical protein